MANMLEIKIMLEAPELEKAINNLAGAIEKTVVHPAKLVEQNAPEAPQQAEAAAPVETSIPQQSEVPEASQSAPDPVQEAPVSTAPTIDLEAISRAGAALIDQGKLPQVMGLLKKYGVQAITQLQTSVYPAFAEELRGLGAAI